MAHHSDALIIVRHVGERTRGLCREILARQVRDGDLVEVTGHPFATTLRASFEAGLAAGRKWTICLDADVIPASSCVARMIELAETRDRPVFECQALVHDWLFGVPRPAGNHIYRTDLLEKAVTLIDETSTTLRPESAVILGMRRAGYSWWQDDGVIGLHDYGQYYRDIVRKVMVLAAKFTAFHGELHDRFTRMVETNQDFRVALEALSAGRAITTVDASLLRAPAAELLARLHLTEKTSLGRDEQEVLTGLLAEMSATPHEARTPLEKRLAPCLGYP
jgi:hypothetical protein